MKAPSTTLLLFLIAPVLHAQWETLADVPADLTFPVVVALNDNIHVIGGGATGGATDLHLRYSTTTGVWDTLAPVPYEAQQPCGAVVNGKIHFCGGGFPNSGTPLSDHYAYDPATDSWTEAAELPFPTVINEAVELDDQLYVLSGQPQRDLSQRYDPVGGTWVANNDLPDDNFWYGAIVSTGETIYRFGGGGYIAPVNLAMVYDKVADSWSYLPDMGTFLHAPAGCALGDSLIVIAGGYWNGAVDDVWLCHIASQSYTAAPALPAARSYHSLVSIGSCVYSVGGSGAEDEIGVSLLRNCTLAGTVSIDALNDGAVRPYELFKLGDRLTVLLRADIRGSAVAQVFDGTGSLVLSTGPASAFAGLHLDGASLPTGRYVVAIRDGGGQRFIEDWVLAR